MKLEQEFGEYFTAVVSGDTPEVSCQAFTAVTAAIIQFTGAAREGEGRHPGTVRRHDMDSIQRKIMKFLV